jgi:ABC-2 type transport system permease protein
MRILFILSGKELRAFFLSPVAYVVIALVMVLTGFSFKAALTILERSSSEWSLVLWTYTSYWFWLSYFPIFPLVTMRLFSEERKLGTMETLLTAPVRTWQVLAAKYTAAVFFYIIIWLPSVLYFLLFVGITGVDVVIPRGELAGSLLILLLSGIFYLAVGCFASALTSNQIVAGVMAFTLCLMHFLLGVFSLNLAGNLPAEIMDMVTYIAPHYHFQRFTRGLIDTRPIFYYLSLAAFFLFLTHQVLEYRRWRA